MSYIRNLNRHSAVDLDAEQNLKTGWELRGLTCGKRVIQLGYQIICESSVRVHDPVLVFCRRGKRWDWRRLGRHDVPLALLQVTVYPSPVEAEGSIWPTSVLDCHRERWIY
jgi:hypothetical protein